MSVFRFLSALGSVGFFVFGRSRVVIWGTLACRLMNAVQRGGLFTIRLQFRSL